MIDSAVAAFIRGASEMNKIITVEMFKECKWRNPEALVSQLREHATDWKVEATTPDADVMNETFMARSCARAADVIEILGSRLDELEEYIGYYEASDETPMDTINVLLEQRRRLLGAAKAALKVDSRLRIGSVLSAECDEVFGLLSDVIRSVEEQG